MIDLAEARAVKAEALAILSGWDAEGARETIWDDSRDYRDVASDRESTSRFPPLALGLSWTQRSGYRLAARVQEESRATGAALDLLRRRGHQELDIKVIGKIQALSASNSKRVRPLERGLSIGADGSTGTLGGFVRDLASGEEPLLLSNNHILARLGKLLPGATVWQPAQRDGGLAGDVVGELVRSVPLDRRASNAVDVAVARVTHPVAYDLAKPRRIVGAEEGIDQDVEKWGRTTGHTQGAITAFDVDGIKVTYEDGREYLFDGQLEIAGTGVFAQGGDSGSLVTTMAGAAVGLLFATSEYGGPSGHGVAYANPIAAALTAVGVDLIL